jgi:hypothetical protein
MKAVLKFNLPEDSNEHFMAINGSVAFSALHEIESELRRLDKYDNEKVIDGKVSIEFIRDTVRDIISELNIRKDGIL